MCRSSETINVNMFLKLAMIRFPGVLIGLSYNELGKVTHFQKHLCSSIETQGAEEFNRLNRSLSLACKPAALYSNLRRSSLYINLHDRYRRTTTSQARESRSVVLYYGNFFIVRMSSRACDVMLLFCGILYAFARRSCKSKYRVYITNQAK